MTKVKIDKGKLINVIQPELEIVGLEQVKKIAKKVLSPEEFKQLGFQVVAGKVKVTGPQDLVDRVLAALPI